MKTYDEDVAAVKALSHGENCYIFWSEEMGGIVYRFDDIYIMDEVTGYGCNQNEYGRFSYEQIEQLVMIAHSWT